ncbi:hypothetical protein [Flagellimonas beolgyonensis]|uniref:hypothetical protein n=1 Tax=Flagellimonas beolgyonensis TaxID=864064 RepID=UPI003D65B720
MKIKYPIVFLFLSFVSFGCSDNDEMETEETENISLVHLTIEGQEIIFNDVTVISEESSTSEYPYRMVAKTTSSPSDPSLRFTLRNLASGTIILNGELIYKGDVYLTLGNDLIIPNVTVHNRSKLEGTFEGNIFKNGKAEESLTLLNGKFNLFLN